MRPSEDSDLLTPDQRLSEVARILATGVLRLQSRAALPDNASEVPAQKNVEDSAPSCLELSAETVLSVHNG